MVTRKILDIGNRERSRRFALVTASLSIVGSGVPAMLGSGPSELAAALPLVVGAVFMTLIGARYARALAGMIIVVSLMPILFARENRIEPIGNAGFASVGAVALAWVHLRQRRKLQERARARRRIVGRAKSRAKNRAK